MNHSHIHETSTAKNIALQGMLYHVAVSLVLSSLWFAGRCNIEAAAADIAFLGIFVWLLEFMKLRNMCRNSKPGLPVEKSGEASPPAVPGKIGFAAKLAKPLLEFIYFISVMHIGSKLFSSYLSGNAFTQNPREKLALQLALASVAFLISLTASVYFARASKSAGRKAIKSCSGTTLVVALLSGMSALSLCSEYFGLRSAVPVLHAVAGAFLMLAGLEILVKFLSRFFLPKTKDQPPRPAYHLYIFDALEAPFEFRRTLADLFERQFGFNLSKGVFFRLTIALAIPFLALSILLQYLLSCFVFIGPGEKGVILRFGQITGVECPPGIHLKAPAPFETCIPVDIWKVRTVHVGSHRLSSNGKDVYGDNPILWSNMHGVSSEELLIVAPPSDMMQNLGNQEEDSLSQKKKVPSISLAGADIFVEYRITNPAQYLSSSSNPEFYFACLAETESTRMLYSYDIDTLFSKGRIEIPGKLLGNLRQAADRAELGIEVLSVGLSGVHPPQEAAQAFEQTISAFQEKEADIQSARQYEVIRMVETAGSLENAEKILAGIKSSEDGILDSKKFAENDKSLSLCLMQSDGAVSESLSAAAAYRMEKINSERGKAERFGKELKLYHAAPGTYLMSQAMNVMERGLGKAKKYVLVGDKESLLLRFDFKESDRRYTPQRLQDPLILPQDEDNGGRN